MKKVLLATTALALSAGVAYAEVSLSGSARMGMNYDESRASDKIQLEYRTRIVLTGSGETDSGLSYSAAIRMNDQTGTISHTSFGVTVSGAFGSLTVGSDSSASEYAVGDIAGVGYAYVGGEATAFLTTSTGARVLYSYTAGDFTAYASAGSLGSDEYSIGGKYSLNGLTIGVGFEDDGVSKATAASVQYAMGDTTVKAVYMDTDDGNGAFTAGAVGRKQMGISAKHTMGAISVAGFYMNNDNATGADTKNYGAGVAYDLGGGAAVKAGVGSTGGNTTADLGMTFSF